MMSRLMSCVVALMVLAATSTAIAQWYPDSDNRSPDHWRYLERQREEFNQRQRDEEAKNKAHAEEMYGSRPFSPQEQAHIDTQQRGQAEQSAKHAADAKALRQELMRLPPLADERNVLLGRWHLEGGGPNSANAARNQAILTGKGFGVGGADVGLADLMGMLGDMDSGKMLCDMSFGRGITFAPTTYSSDGVAGIAEGSIAYRSRNKKIIVAIPGDSRAAPMPFEIAGPNRIVWKDACALIRVGAPATNTATNTATAPLRPTLSRPSPEVCRNTLLDKIGTVGTNQVRAMSDVRYKEAAIESKVPNTNNLRIDLRGSACDDPRIKATLYDFDANEMLQSITYVWDRPPGPAPAPIFSERIAQLSRFHSLPPPQSPGRLQANTSLGRLILEDMPERNLLLEAYAARK